MQARARNRARNAHFNPTLVQLESDAAVRAAVPSAHFNPTLVQLELRCAVGVAVGLF